MIAYYQKRSQGEEFEKLSRPHASDMWLDGSNLSEDDINAIVKDYKLDGNIVYDVRDRQELSRVEFSDDNGYVFLRAPHLTNTGHVAALPLLCIVKADTFLTLSQHDTYSPEAVAATTLPLDTSKTADLLFGVIAACVSAYQELIKHTERSINDTAARLQTHEVTNRDFIHFVTVEDNLTSFHINLEGILSVLTRLSETQHLSLSDDNHEALDDIVQNIRQLLVAVQSYTSRVESIRNAYTTIADNALNQRMKTLTVLTVLITLPNIIYGMFGMNVWLPIGQGPWGYVAVVGFSVVITLSVYVIGKKRKLF